MQGRWAKDKFMRNTELCFVCKVGFCEDAVLSFIARDSYNLYINGKFVQYGPARAAKGYARVENVALGQYLTEGENVIAVYVQTNATKTLCFALEEPLFAAEIRDGGKLLRETDDFACYEMIDKVRKVERMSSQRGYVEVYRMQKDREPFDERLYEKCELVPVAMPKLLERNVAVATHEIVKAEKIEQGGVRVDPTLSWENDFTRLLDSGKNLMSYTRSECDVVLSKELLPFVFEKDETSAELRYETYDFSRTRCGKFQIKLSVKARTTLWLVYDDILIDGKIKFNREQITHGLKWELEKGDYTLHSNEVYVAKYVGLIISGDAEIQEVSFINVENPNAGRMQFTCADKDLEKIVDAARHSFEHNAYDLLTDCPSRERAGYLCDGFFEARAEQFFSGENPVEKNLLENYALYTNEYFPHDGILPMCYPSVAAGKDDFIPNWILWYVLQLEDYFLRTGDEGFVKGRSEQIKTILEYFQNYENEYGLLENLEGWVFVEWSKANDFVDGVNFPSNMCYYGALRAAARILEDKALAQKAERLKETIVKLSYNGEFFVDNALRENGKLKITKNISETCQNYAAFFQIFTKEENPAFYQRLINALGCFHREAKNGGVYASNMFIGYVLRLMILLREGEYEAVLAECKNRFLDMAQSTGTIWELFQTNASCDHGFGAIVGQLIVYSLCGILEIDEKTKTVYVTEKYPAIDCEVCLPLFGGVATVCVQVGERTIVVPDGYRLEIVKR